MLTHTQTYMYTHIPHTLIFTYLLTLIYVTHVQIFTAKYKIMALVILRETKTHSEWVSLLPSDGGAPGSPSVLQ